MATKYVYYKKNVGFNVGLRFHIRDVDGIVLTGANPYINIDEDNLRDFLQANKTAIQKGLIIQVEEPSFDFVTENTITDEDAEELVKNLFILRKRLPQISSEATLGKLYEAAKRQGRAKKILTMIEDRLTDVSPVYQQGVGWGEEDEKFTGGE
jgi:DNA-directed RNA polymerase subunit H (RpoH/RPB5)